MITQIVLLFCLTMVVLSSIPAARYLYWGWILSVIYSCAVACGYFFALQDLTCLRKNCWKWTNGLVHPAWYGALVLLAGGVGIPIQAERG